MCSLYEALLCTAIVAWYYCSIIHPSKTYILLFQLVSGAEGLLSIGAIEFLSHLRQDIDPELYQNVDNVIHQLLSLPQKDATDHDQLCLYKDHENPVKNDHQQSSGTGSVEFLFLYYF